MLATNTETKSKKPTNLRARQTDTSLQEWYEELKAIKDRLNLLRIMAHEIREMMENNGTSLVCFEFLDKLFEEEVEKLELHIDRYQVD